MPLPLIPFILGGIGATAAAIGVLKGIKAGIDIKDANETNESANRILIKGKDGLELCRNASNTALEALGSKKLYVLDRSISRFVASFEKIINVQLEESVGLEELDKFRLDNQSISELKDLSAYASSILGGAMAGTLGGALAGFGAYSAVMTFGAASTGTAIASLSGVMATNATLAFLGGGSLAVGGLGMAGGTVILGGLIAGPALAIMGFIIGAKASENLDNAYSNLAEAKKIVEQLGIASVLCNNIRRRSNIFERLLIRLEALFIPLVIGMENVIKQKGEDWNKFSNEEKLNIASAASIAKAIKTILDTSLLTDDGNLTEESAQVLGEIQTLLNAYKTV